MESHGELAGCGAAKLRRERRLRQWHRHERLTVQMASCEALHHSAPQVERCENSAPRGQDAQGRWAARSPAGSCAAAGCRALGVPVLLSAVAGHAVSGGCDGRRGGLRLRPFPRGFCVGGQKEGGGGAEEEHGGEGAVARCAACFPDTGAEALDRRALR